MQQKRKKHRLDRGQIFGAIIFILFFFGLILLGLYYDSDAQFENNFFEDVARVMQWN